MVTTKTTILAGTLVVVAIFLTTLPATKAQPPMGAPGPSPPTPMAYSPGPSGGLPVASPGPSRGLPVAAPGPSLDCFSYLANLSGCLTFVEAGSNLTMPEKGCCPELAGLVENKPICLCQLLGNSDSYGIQIEVAKALKLPDLCGVSTPPVSLCTAAGIPVAFPPTSEGPATTSGMSPEGLAAAPRIAASDLSFLLGLAIAFLTTFF
ncbi:unnamed protein product [Ilex paraguariensis]|uniref:Bifunctional inhibitor/plant lipid transfer protein/seed storage helical domain-containing protein n=1 Tax=Ilex paraguariensis TaxID=185542 RepID=A0ABC8UUN0_9AQUA